MAKPKNSGVVIEAKGQFLEKVEPEKLTKDKPPASQIDGLDLSYNYLTTLSGVAPFCRLLRLDVSHNHIDELQQLAITITSLSAAYNRLSSLTGIEDLRALTELDVSYNSISDLRQVGSLMHLTTLRVAGNKIRSVEGLERLQRLKNLDLRNNLLAAPDAAAPLAQNPRLANLELSGNPLTRARGWKLEVLQFVMSLEFLDGERLERRLNRPPSPARKPLPPRPPPEPVAPGQQTQPVPQGSPLRQPLNDGRWPFLSGQSPSRGPSSLASFDFGSESGRRTYRSPSPPRSLASAPSLAASSSSRLLLMRSPSPSKEDLRAAAMSLKKELGLSPPRSARRNLGEPSVFLAASALEQPPPAPPSLVGTHRAASPAASQSRLMELYDPLDPTVALAAAAEDFELRQSAPRARRGSGQLALGAPSGRSWRARRARRRRRCRGGPRRASGTCPTCRARSTTTTRGLPLEAAAALQAVVEATSEEEHGATPPRGRPAWAPPQPPQPPAPVLSSAYAAAYRSPSPPHSRSLSVDVAPAPRSRQGPGPLSPPRSARSVGARSISSFSRASARSGGSGSVEPAVPHRHSWALRVAGSPRAGTELLADLHGSSRARSLAAATDGPGPGILRPASSLSSTSSSAPALPPRTRRSQRPTPAPPARSLSPARNRTAPPASWSSIFRAASASASAASAAAAGSGKSKPPAQPRRAPLNESISAWDAGDASSGAPSDLAPSPPRSLPGSPARAPAASAAPATAPVQRSAPVLQHGAHARRQGRRSAEVVVWSGAALEGLAQLLRSPQAAVRSKALLVLAGVLDSDENARNALSLDICPSLADLLRSSDPSAVADTCHCVARLAAVWDPQSSPNGPHLLALSYPLLTVAAGPDPGLQASAMAALEALAAKGLTSESPPPPSPTAARQPGEGPGPDAAGAGPEPEVARRLEFEGRGGQQGPPGPEPAPEAGAGAELDESGQGEALLRRKRSNRIVHQILHPEEAAAAPPGAAGPAYHQLSLAELADRPLGDLSPDWRTPSPPPPPSPPDPPPPARWPPGAPAAPRRTPWMWTPRAAPPHD
eukprot:tig00021073_g18064.t1